MTLNFKTWAFATSALAISAAPAFAQGICGGVGDGGQWIGGAEVASDVTSSGSHMEQMALVLANNQYVSLFNVTAPTDVRLEAQGRGGGDPVIDLYDDSGNIILSDDDSGGEGSSFAESMLDPGTYCLAMSSYDGSPMTGFVRVGRLEHEQLTMGMGMGVDDDDMGGDIVPSGGGCAAVANYFGDGGPIDGSLGAGTSVTASVNQVDAWGFSLTSPAAVTITAVNENADPVITLYDAMGNYIDSNDDYDGLNSQIDVTGGLAPGEYCIEMEALSDSNEPITVSVMEYDPNAELYAMIAMGEAAPPMDGSWPIEDLGVVETRMRHDAQVGGDASWFQFEVLEGGVILAEAIANGNGDPVAFLYDDLGRELAWNDDSGEGYDSLVAARVLPGTYLLAVRQYDENSQSLIRLVFERYVPAR